MADAAADGTPLKEQAAGENTLKLTLRLTTHPVDPVPSNHLMTVLRTASVLDVKTRIADEWQGKPKVEGIVCVQGGRVCRDTETVDELFSKTVSVHLTSGLVVLARLTSRPHTRPRNETQCFMSLCDRRRGLCRSQPETR